MPLEIRDGGRGNAVRIDGAGRERCRGVVALEGDGSVVEVGEGGSATGLMITVGSGCRVTIGTGCSLAALEIFARSGAEVTIGDGCAFTHHTRVFLHEPGRISIGADCLVASGTLLMNSDIHPIFDLRTGERINGARDVSIGSRVWLGADVTALKGAAVGDGSIVGYRSVVTGAIPADSMAVGAPARVVRAGVRWAKDLP